MLNTANYMSFFSWEYFPWLGKEDVIMYGARETFPALAVFLSGLVNLNLLLLLFSSQAVLHEFTQCYQLI